MFTSCAPFVSGSGGRSGGGSSNSGGGILRRSGGVVVVGEEFVDEGPATGGGGLRSLRIKRPLVLKPAGGGGGSSLIGLGEREVPGRSLVTTDVGLPRNRRTPFILPTELAATVGRTFRVLLSCVQPRCSGIATAGEHNDREKKRKSTARGPLTQGYIESPQSNSSRLSHN